MNLEEALEKFGLKLSDEDKEQDLERYNEDSQKFQRMLEESKLHTFGLNSPATTERKVAVVLAGQIGGGKSSLVVDSAFKLNQIGQDVVIIDDDQYRNYYPEANKINREVPEYFVPISATGSNPVTPLVMQEAVDRGYNFVFDGTMKNRRILDTMKTWPEHYQKIVKVIATSDIESLLSMFERHDAMMSIGENSRLVGVDAHNATYEGVPETLGILEQEKLADRIEVYVRGKDARKPKMVYSSDWQENIYETAKEALLAERRKDRQRARTTIERRLNNIKNPHSRVLSQTEIDKISELESQLRQIEQEMESMERNDPDSQDR